MKFNFPMAFTQTVLAWGAIYYPGGYEQSGQRQYIIENLKWGADYLIGCHTAEQELINQVPQHFKDLA